MKLGIQVGLGLCRIVLMGTQLPPKGAQPPFAAHVYCDQTAGWINFKIPLGTEVDLGPGHIVLSPGSMYVKIKLF